MTKYVTRSGWQQQEASLHATRKRLNKIYDRWPDPPSDVKNGLIKAVSHIDAAIAECRREELKLKRR